MNIEEEVKKLIENDINKLGISLEKIEFVKEDGIYFLRIYIDKEPIININDCVNVTKLIDPILDKNNLIDKSYILDVCSKKKEGK